VDSISRSFDKRVTAKPSHCAVEYKLLTDDQCQELDVRYACYRYLFMNL
ncbi:hypothetical protein A2U01_0056437, partial [Trifolium medium]|nr:hypothetical protein [Trifolium medium]